MKNVKHAKKEEQKIGALYSFRRAAERFFWTNKRSAARRGEMKSNAFIFHCMFYIFHSPL